MNLGNKIQEIRKKNKMSQEEFAEIFNVTRQTISSWENSKSYPDIETLIKLSDKFDISLDILLKEDKVMVKKIDKERKNYKKIKKLIFIICSLLMIVGIIYGIKYVSFSKRYDKVKNEIEVKYYQTLKDYNFEKSDRIYTLKVSDNVKFVAGSQEMPPKKDRASMMKEPWGYVAIGILAPLAEDGVFRGAILRTLLGIMSKKNHWAHRLVCIQRKTKPLYWMKILRLYGA